MKSKIELEGMTKRALVAYGKTLGIDIDNKLKKADIVDQLADIDIEESIEEVVEPSKNPLIKFAIKPIIEPMPRPVIKPIVEPMIEQMVEDPIVEIDTTEADRRERRRRYHAL